MKFSTPRNVAQYISRRAAISETLFEQIGWTTTSYAIVQAVRFGQNLFLTHLLAPNLFGVMIILTSLRFGIELFTDIGINQNLVANRNAWTPGFYNTAWTLQIIRSLFLSIIFVVLMPTISSFYGDSTLDTILPIVIVLFVVTGTHSMGAPLAIKALDTKTFARYEVTSSLVGSALTIASALIFPNIWGLVAGNVLSTIASSILSYLVWPKIRHKLTFEKLFVGQIVSFGKWIFISSIIYFLAGNFDRLTLGKYLDLGLLGVYGIARSLGDIFGQFALRLGDSIIFPLVASSDLDPLKLRQKLARRRIQFLSPAVVVMSLFIALSDTIIRILYDIRYVSAGTILPWIGLAIWVFVLNTLSDSVMLGIRKPAYNAIGNGGKFLTLLLILPWAAFEYGLIGAVLTTVLAEISRYVLLMFAQIKERYHFIRQDILTTIAMILGALALRKLGYDLGLTGSADELFALPTLR